MILSYKYHRFRLPLWALRLLKRHTVYVRAAGGIVTAPDGTMLLIRRNGRWDLAKGKVESGETLLQAALREVEEETGIKVFSVQCSVFSYATQSCGSPLNTKHLTLNTNNSSLITHHSSLIKTYHLFRAPKAWFKGPNPPPHKWHLKQTS
jgi:8-oxo-dGTP pyrophosphatase MutT (NUDIX family)